MKVFFMDFFKLVPRDFNAMIKIRLRWNKIYYVIRNAGWANSKNTFKLTQFFKSMNELINQLFLERITCL